MFLCEQVFQPFPVGLVASTLHRKLGLLRDLCFSDAEYGDVAQAPQRLQCRVAQPLNRELERSGKHLHLVAITPCTTKHNRIVVTYQCDGEVQKRTTEFLLFPASVRAQARDSDPEAETSGPRRGGTSKATRKKKQPKPNLWE